MYWRGLCLTQTFSDIEKFAIIRSVCQENKMAWTYINLDVYKAFSMDQHPGLSVGSALAPWGALGDVWRHGCLSQPGERRGAVAIVWAGPGQPPRKDSELQNPFFPFSSIHW